MRSLNFTPNPISLLNPKTKYNRSLNCQNRCRRCSSAVWNAALANVVPTWMVWLGLRPTWYRRGAYVVIWSRKNKKPVGLDVSYTQKKNKNGWDPPSSLLPSPYPPPPTLLQEDGWSGWRRASSLPSPPRQRSTHFSNRRRPRHRPGARRQRTMTNNAGTADDVEQPVASPQTTDRLLAFCRPGGDFHD